MTSDLADKLIQKSFNDAHIVDIFETLNHDGYDRDGPESNIWDLHMIVLENDVYTYYRFHCEDWFYNRPVEYEPYYTATIESIYSADEKTTGRLVLQAIYRIHGYGR